MRMLRLVLVSMVAAAACSSSSSHNDAASGAGGAGGKDSGVVGGTGSLYPLAVGSHWVYQVTDTDGTVSTDVVSVVAQETVGGTGPYAAQAAFRVVTGSKINDPNGDVDWEAETTTPTQRIVRYRELSVGETKGHQKGESYWDPPRLRLDESADRTTDGQTWQEGYTEYDIDYTTDADAGVTTIKDGGMTTEPPETDIWSVVAASEVVTVGGQMFTALHVKRINTNPDDSSANGGIKEFWFARGIGLVKETGNGKPTHELTSYTIAGQ